MDVRFLKRYVSQCLLENVMQHFDDASGATTEQMVDNFHDCLEMFRFNFD